MSVVRARIISIAVVVVIASGCALTQNVEARAANAPRIILKLPDNIPSELFWIRYSLSGPGGTGGTITGGKVEKELKLRQYEIYAMIGGTPAQHAKIVIYAPGCQFKTYTIDLGSADISEQFDCEPLPTKTIHGLLPPNQVPSTTYQAVKKLDVVAYLDDNWVCGFFLRTQIGSSVIIAGSCLGSPIPLGTVGEIDPARGGAFDITIPDFARDPVFGSSGVAPRVRDFGVIQLALCEKNVRRVLAAIKAEGTDARSGLNVQLEYREPVMFTWVR